MANVTIQLPAPSTYGAVEIKEIIKKYTVRGFLYTMGVIILMIIMFFAANKVSEMKTVKKAAPPVSKISITAPPPDATQEEEVVTQEMPQDMVELATLAKAGNPVPVPDAEVTELKDFASFDQLSESLSKETGQIVDLNAMGANVSFDAKPQAVEVKQEEKIPDEDDFVAFEKEPYVDPAEIARNVEYPEVAKRAGIEGRVTLSVFIDKNGRAKKVNVKATTSQSLNKAAIDAANKTTFSPGIQNGQPVQCWITIPVVFKLR